MFKRFVWLPFLLLLFTNAAAQSPIVYTLAFPNAVHHEAEISVRLTDLPAKTLELRMSRSSPGRYAIHEFAKNVYRVKAVDGEGNTLKITRPNPYQWDIPQHDGTVIVSYTLFADRADGTYSGIDETHAHINIPATFMWARGLSDRAISVHFDVSPDRDWHVATQLQPTQNPFTFTSPNLYYFLDSPIELSAYTLREWPVHSAGREQTIRLALHHDGTEAEADAYAEMARRVVYEQEGIFGELPVFDFGTYTFLADYLPHVSGDGMEHRNSTIISSRRPLRTGAERNIGTLAHEFFHAWNVERIRPKSLEPFNFEQANMSGELWFAEGFTSYYTPLTLIRAGLTPIDDFAQSLSRSVNEVANAPGRQFFSPVEMSMQAPFVDAATAIDPTNRDNTFISYYTYGMVTGLALDLAIRTTFPGKSLDDLMREMWNRHGKTEKPYTNEDILSALAATTGDADFAQNFFDRYIYGRELADYKNLLAAAGFLMRPARPGAATLGKILLRFRGNKAIVASSTLIGSPLYEAGIGQGDELLALGGKDITTQEAYDAVLAAHQPGAQIEVRFWQRGHERQAVMVFAEGAQLEIVPYEHAGMAVTDEIDEFREQWLGSKAITNLPALEKYCHVCSRTFSFAQHFCDFDGEKLRITPKEMMDK